MIRLHNTMSRAVEAFQPLKDQTVSFYSCGPTVYDYPHIGNWYAFIHWDLLVRMLKASGYKTTWVMNITDVGHLVSDADEGEDKIEKGAEREGKSAWEIARYYSDYFIAALKRLNFIEPDRLPKATDNVTEQIKIIEILQKNGFSYVIDDGVYFDTSQLPDYGRLARLNRQSIKAGARVALNPEKKNPTDFALWKFSPKDHQRDMEWPSPWGVGFPSWHIECSTMIKKFLGETIDIHAGGIDHIAIHHTNEIAISEATTGKALAKYWLHSNFVMVDNQKISKSIGNTITLEDIEAKGFSLEAFRLWALQSHYRNEAQFSWPILQAAQNRLDSYQAMADLIWQPVKTDSLNKIVFSDSKILSSLQSDLNSPQALSIIDDKAAILSTKLLPATDINNFRHMLSSIDKLFGLKLADRPDISDAQKTMIASRETARRDKDFVKSDNLRKKLQEQSILVRDTPQGPIWSRLGNQA